MASPTRSAPAGGEEGPGATGALDSIRDALTRIESTRKTVGRLEEALAVGLVSVRATIKQLAAESWPTLERFYEEVAAAAPASGVRCRSTYTVRNALAPGAAGQFDLVALAARVVLAGPSEAGPSEVAR